MNDQSNSSESSVETIFNKVCSADEALELSLNSDVVLFNRGCISGEKIWNDFYEDVRAGTPSSVLCANYYVLDRDHVSEELYRQEKDNYPKLWFIYLEYDGNKFYVKERECTSAYPEYSDSFQYLLHFRGEAPPSALFTEYDNYVLVDDPNLTWSEIQLSMVSSHVGSAKKHYTVYWGYIGWKN